MTSQLFISFSATRSTKTFHSARLSRFRRRSNTASSGRGTSSRAHSRRNQSCSTSSGRKTRPLTVHCRHVQSNVFVCVLSDVIDCCVGVVEFGGRSDCGRKCAGEQVVLFEASELVALPRSRTMQVRKILQPQSQVPTSGVPSRHAHAQRK